MDLKVNNDSNIQKDISLLISEIDSVTHELSVKLAYKIIELANLSGGVLYLKKLTKFRTQRNDSICAYARYINLNNNTIYLDYDLFTEEYHDFLDNCEDKYESAEELSHLGIEALKNLLENCVVINPNRSTIINVFLVDKEGEEIIETCMILPKDFNEDINQHTVIDGYKDDEIFYYFYHGSNILDRIEEDFVVKRFEVLS